MKKLNKFFAVLLALAMMATLAVTMAFAEGEPTTAPLTKNLTVPQGTAIPEGSYATFSFADEKVNGAEAAADDAKIPEQEIKFTDGTKATDDEKNVDVYTYKIDDVLNGIQWKRPGVYTWNVSEKDYVIDDKNDATTDVATKDTQEYTLVVNIVYDNDGNLVVGGVTTKKGKDNTSEPTDENKADGLTFNNSYYTTTGNQDPEDPTKPGDKDNDGNGLSVEKTVEGKYGDQKTQFEITVNVKSPAIGDAAKPTAVIRRVDGTTIDAVTINEGDNKVMLASGDRLVFTKIAEGTKYTVKETDTRKGTEAEQYTASGEVEEAKAVTKDKNSETVVNKSNQDDQTPTGILVSNLPYIALALVAVGGLVAYVVIRRRESDNA